MPQREPDEDPPVWITILKLVAVAVVLIGGVGLALWYAGKNQDPSVPSDTATSGPSWGIVTDSPLRNKR